MVVQPQLPGFNLCPLCNEEHEPLKDHMAAEHSDWVPEPIPVDG